MKPEDRPELAKTSKLVGPSGDTIKEKGKGMFALKLGPVHLEIEAIVADIDDDGLLGVDVLQNGDDGPADLLLSKGVLIINRQEVPIIQVGLENRVRKVTSADHFIIPAQSECIIEAYVERREYDDFTTDREYIIEPTEHFRETYPLQMASTLVDINRACTCKVRLLNPFPTSMSIKQDAVIGNAEPVEGRPKVVVGQEDHGQSKNYARVRRINLPQNEKEDITEKATVRALDVDIRAAEIPCHLRELYDRATERLEVQQKERVAHLLSTYQDTFSRDEWDLGLTHLTEHSINTGDAPPIKQAPRRVPLAFAKDEKKAIEDLKEKGVIRESVSPWASPIVLVSKKNGGVRPCVDYRKVNELVKPDGFPLPRIQDCLDAVAGSSLFSTFDLTSGYFQIPLKEEDIPKSAFVCKYGHFEMTRMPFGLNNSASTFQRTMEMALQGLQWVTCLIYIDDIIVFGRHFDEHLSRVKEVLERIRAAGLKLKPDKCMMLQKAVTFLGHEVSGEGVKPTPTNIEKIVNWPKPRTPRQVKQFVAMGSYYRRYVKDFASIVRPMVELTKKGKKFVWTPDCDKSFDKLKQALISSDIMGYPLNEAGSFILDVDASDIGIGGVLHQEQNGKEKVIAYASRALNKAEKNYCITEKELLAVRFFIEYFRQYLLGRRFLVRSDHQALVWIFRLKEPRGKVARWLEILSQYDFAIEYRPGKKHGHCDALSRCENPKDCDCPGQDTSELLKCGPCSKCIKRAQEMLHKTWSFESSSVSGVEGIKLGDERTEPLNLQGKKEVKAHTQSRTQAGPKNVKSAEVGPKLEQNVVKATRGGSENSKPEPGPSSQGQERPKEQQNPATSVMAWVGSKSSEDLSRLQDTDPDIGPILRAKVQGIRPSSKEMVSMSPASRHYWILWESLVIEKGLLFKKFIKRDGTGEYRQFVVPKVMKQEILFQMHNSILSGHLGCKKTKEKTLQRFYWYALKEDIYLHIKKCDVCAVNKKTLKTPRAPMGSLAAGAPGDCIATDYLGPFPVTDMGNRYILLLTDHFSKYVEVLAVPDMTAEVCATKIVNEFIARWGCPLAIHSDQGRTFESKVFREMCRMLEIRKTRTSPRNPRCNGQSERFNRTLLRMIKAYLCGEQHDWDLHLGCLAGAYRATPNESTRLTPNLLTMGREVRLPAELVFGSFTASNQGEITSYGDFVDQLRSRMQHAHEVARKYLSSAAKRSKEMYDVKMAVNKYERGDLVWCLDETRKVGIMSKLGNAYDGPFLVKKKVTELDFVLQLNQDGDEKLVHHNKLKPYEGDSPPNWLKRARRKLLRCPDLQD